jgi:hypothetical protein
VRAAFGLMLTSKTYRQEAQTQGIAEQKLTIEFRGGGGVITGTRLLAAIVNTKTGELRPVEISVLGLVPGATRRIPEYGLTATLNAAGDELIIIGARGSPIVVCVEPQGRFESTGTKSIFLNAQITPQGAKAAAVGEAETFGQVQADVPIVGPMVVPGNSRYAFKVTGVDNGQWTVGNGGKVIGDGKGSEAKIEFANQPNIVPITVDGTKDGKKVQGKRDVYVVQVNVTTPTTAKAGDKKTFTGAFAANQAFKAGKPTDNGFINAAFPFTIDGKAVDLPPVTILSGDFDADPSKVDQTMAGLEWRAQITLNGPTVNEQKNFGVDKIHVGFIQHITPVFRGFYGANPVVTLVSTIEDNKNVLDAPSGQKVPWYSQGNLTPDFAQSTFTKATPQQNSKEISASDRPAGTLPNAASQLSFLNRVELKWDFVLEVAAVAPGDNLTADKYFSEAFVNWSFIGTGTVSKNFAWTGTNAQIVPPKSWTATPQVKEIDLPKPAADGVFPVFNDTYNIRQRNWTTKK